MSKAAVKTKLCLLIFIATIMLAVPLSATVVQRLNLDDLVTRADSIVIGRVVDSRSSWTKDGKLILTYTTLAVQEGLKGTPSSTITVTTIGGQIGKTILHVSGMPSFERNETAVIFLERSGGYSTVLGLSQGKFSIRNGEVSNAIQGLRFNDAVAARSVRMPLDEFKRQIQQRLHR